MKILFCHLFVHYPYNRSKKHNDYVSSKIDDGKADTVTISNVLNVIKEKEMRAEVILYAVDAVKKDSSVYITIYEGNGLGESTSRPTYNPARVALTEI